jgi:hypothetical protein
MKEHSFFAKQRIDAAGNAAVALQKLLIALWVMTLFSVFIATGFGILGILLESTLIFIGLYGAVKRRPRWLNFFWIVQLIFVIFYSLFVVLQVIVVTTFIAKYELLFFSFSNDTFFELDFFACSFDLRFT